MRYILFERLKDHIYIYIGEKSNAREMNIFFIQMNSLNKAF